MYVLPLSSFDPNRTKAEIRTPSSGVTAIAFREDHPRSYIAATALGFAFVDEKGVAIQMLKLKRSSDHPRWRSVA